MTAVHVNTRELDTADIEALLSKHHVGVMAMGFHNRVTITLINYVYADRWIYGRMEHGPDIEALQHHRWVAVEVRETDGIYDWRTVTAAGPIDFLFEGASVRESAEAKAALDRLRSVVPAIFTPRDPMPQRVQLFRVFADELSGRIAESNAGAALPAA